MRMMSNQSFINNGGGVWMSLPAVAQAQLKSPFHSPDSTVSPCGQSTTSWTPPSCSSLSPWRRHCNQIHHSDLSSTYRRGRSRRHTREKQNKFKKQIKSFPGYKSAQNLSFQRFSIQGNIRSEMTNVFNRFDVNFGHAQKSPVAALLNMDY